MVLLHQSQKTIAKDKTRFKVLCCGRRWGKTTYAVELIKATALSKECSICYIAPTIQQARDICWAMLLKELQPIIVKSKEAPSLELEVRNQLGTTSIIKLRGWEAVETLRGQAFDLLVIDEVASMRNFWSGWSEVLRPTLNDRIGSALFISTPKGFNHFNTLYRKQDSDHDYKSFHFTSYDNPHNKEEELNKAKSELDENQFATEYLADFRKVTGLVYNLPGEQIVEPLDIKCRTEARIMGVDWGFRNPAAIVVLYLYDKEWYVVEDWKMAGRTTAEIIQVMNNMVNEHRITKIYPDPAEPDRIEECRRAGLPVLEANKDIEGGVSHIQNLIKERRFKVCNNCIQTIEEMNTYQYPEGADGKPFKDVPEKMNDHLMDSMRYAIYSYKGNRIISMQASPLAKTYYDKL